MGELTDKAKGLGNQIAGKAKEQSNDPETRAEGKAQKTKGQAQSVMGDVKGALGDKV